MAERLNNLPKAQKEKAAAKPSKVEPRSAMGLAWFERLGVKSIWSSIADRGRRFAALPPPSVAPQERARLLAEALMSGRGEASGAAVARELLGVLQSMDAESRREVYIYAATHFAPDPKKLEMAAKDYLAAGTPETAAALADAAEPVRQELLRRMNMAPGGTAMLVAMRKEILSLLPANPELRPLEADLLHLLTSWFNRGFLELRRIDWNTPAVVLDKLIAYEAVHEIQGWEDLRRRLAPDRRCFGFFHPALPGEPLIFVEVALVDGLAGSVTNLLARDTSEAEQRVQAQAADTAIFYSISNCQDGLRGISFGNFLIKQVVEDLRTDLPQLKQFSTLSPIPGFRKWVEKQVTAQSLPDLALSVEARSALQEALGLDINTTDDALLGAALGPADWSRPGLKAALKGPLSKLCAIYLTMTRPGKGPLDAVAKFHLGNGARLERLNWMGNTGERGFRESYGLMVNYLYDIASIEANHEAFIRDDIIARSDQVAALLAPMPRIVEVKRKGIAAMIPQLRN